MNKQDNILCTRIKLSYDKDNYKKRKDNQDEVIKRNIDFQQNNITKHDVRSPRLRSVVSI